MITELAPDRRPVALPLQPGLVRRVEMCRIILDMSCATLLPVLLAFAALVFFRVFPDPLLYLAMYSLALSHAPDHPQTFLVGHQAGQQNPRSTALGTLATVEP